MSAESEFVEALLVKQRESGLSGRQFARRIGVSVALWHRVSHGERPVSMMFAQRAIRAFPELTGRALFLLSSESTVSNADVRKKLPA